jgi:D-glycero-alpha-D-manno-heptose 1-phosphate guanylyltransferase
LAGGFGTRLKSIISDMPKAMAPIQGRPFLDILLHSLAAKGFGRIILSLHYKSNVIKNYFGGSFAGIEIEYVVEESPLGTGGAARLALSSCREDHAFIFNGDTYLDQDFLAIDALWRTQRNPIIVGCNVDDTSRYGRLLEKNGFMVGYSEKGVFGSGLINSGCYVLGIAELNSWPVNKPFSLESDFFEKKAKENLIIQVYKSNGLFIDIGIPEDYSRAQNLLEII